MEILDSLQNTNYNKGINCNLLQSGGGYMGKQNKLREYRLERGLTQKDMARLLGYKDKSGYCHLENGKVAITIEKAKKIGDILGVSPEEIFF